MLIVDSIIVTRLFWWNNSRKEIENPVTIVNELIDIRDGYKECVGFSSQELKADQLDS